MIAPLLQHHLHTPERLLLLTGGNLTDALIDRVPGGADRWSKYENLTVGRENSARIWPVGVEACRAGAPAHKLGVRRVSRYPVRPNCNESKQQSSE